MMPTIKGLHHWAYRCRDAEETRHFYEDILGLPLAHVIKEDYVPSTGEYCPYVHIFFELGDKSCVAFFDLGDETATVPDPGTPRWVNHLALEVENLDELKEAKARLERNGVEVLGITDHGFVRSIYFFDPNGVRLELTCKTTGPETTDRFKKEAHAILKEWTGRERKPVAAGPRSGAASPS
jgi:catechol 2,3-dioxygenase-like lactoylglutathione lyase family enzyme